MQDGGADVKETWPPELAAINAVTALFHDALKFPHAEISILGTGSKARKRTPSEADKLRDLRTKLKLETDFSRWCSGSLRIGVGRNGKRTVECVGARFNRRMLRYLTGQEYLDDFNKEVREEDRKFAREVLEYWNRPEDEARQRLSDARALLEAHGDYLAEQLGTFARQNDKSRDGDVARAAASARQAGNQSSNFVLDPTPTTLPRALRTKKPPLFRDDELAQLGRLYAQLNEDGVLVFVAGPPGSGKSKLIRQFTTGLATEPRPIGDLAMLHVDLADVRPLRAALDAAGVRFGNVRSRETMDEGSEDEDEEDGDGEYAEQLRAFVRKISSSLGQRTLVAVFEGFSNFALRDKYEPDLRALLETSVLAEAFQVLETWGEPVETKLPSIRLSIPAFESVEAMAFLVHYQQEETTAQDAVELLAIDSENLFYPRPLRQGAAECHPEGFTRGATPDGIDLASAIEADAGKIARTVVERACRSGKCHFADAMISLMAMAIFRNLPTSIDLMKLAGLADVPDSELARVGWMAEEYGALRLTGFGLSAVLAEAGVVLGGHRGATDRVRLRDAILALAQAWLDDAEARRPLALEGARGWIVQHAQNETDLIARMTALAVQAGSGDLVPPLTPAEEEEAAPDLLKRGREGDVDEAIAALVLYARSPVRDDHAEALSRKGFVDSLRAVMARVETVGELKFRQLGAVDTALVLGVRRYQLYQEGSDARRALMAALASREAEAMATADASWLLSWLSQMLNLANAATSLGRLDEAYGLFERAGRLIRSDWWRSTPWTCWLEARFEILHERLAKEPAEALDALCRAAKAAADGLSLDPDGSRALKFYLRVVRRLIRRERDDDARKAHVDDASMLLGEIFGGIESWDVSLRAQFAALMRDEARRAWSLDYQSRRARQALDMLRGRDGEREGDVLGDPQASLVQARLQAFLGERSDALASCERAIELSLSASAWHLKLRLLDFEDGGREDWSGEMQRDSSSGEIPEPLRRAIDEFRARSAGNHGATKGFGQVSLWILRREWRAQRSLEVWVKVREARRGGDFSALPKTEKLKLLRSAFTERQSKLESLKKRYGNSISFVLAKFDNHAQFARSSQIIDPKIQFDDPRSTLKADVHPWRESHILQFHLAEYERYTWNIDAAISGFRKVAASATNGDLRRQAEAALARTLHTAATQTLEIGDPQRATLLTEAQALVGSLVGDPEHAISMAILRDHLAFERGEAVDWSAMEEAYEQAVDIIDALGRGLVRASNFFVENLERAPTSLADVLKKDFSDPEALGLAGLLYVRRATKGEGNARDEDFIRGLRLLRAAALLERSWEGIERPTTTFRIAQAICSAADIFQSVNPIPGLATEGKPDQMAFALSCFQSAFSRSAGEFRRWLHEQLLTATQLRTHLLSIEQS